MAFVRTPILALHLQRFFNTSDLQDPNLRTAARQGGGEERKPFTNKIKKVNRLYINTKANAVLQCLTLNSPSLVSLTHQLPKWINKRQKMRFTHGLLVPSRSRNSCRDLQISNRSKVLQSLDTIAVNPTLFISFKHFNAGVKHCSQTSNNRVN